MTRRATSGQPDYNRLATDAIDQFVVDGLVERGPVDVKEMGGLALWGFQKIEGALAAFEAALQCDPRFQGAEGNSYSFASTLSPDSTAKPSMWAIVTGMAECSPKERAHVLGAMNGLAEVIYKYYHHDPSEHDLNGVVSMHRIRNLFKQVEIKLSPYQLKAFIAYVDQDPRFAVLDDGRIVLAGIYKGNIEDIPPLKEVTSAVVDAAIEALGREYVRADAMIRYLYSQGYRVESGVGPSVASILKSHPNLQQVSVSGFRVIQRSSRPQSGSSVVV